MRYTGKLFLGASLFVLASGIVAGPVFGQTPKRGGTLTIGTDSDTPSLDCHAAATSSALLAFMSSVQAFLIRYDPANYPSIVGDLAESWMISPDGLTYTFKLRSNVKFHDGAPLTSADVKATFDRIAKPPAGVVSARQIEYTEVTSIEAPDPLTIVFKLSKRNAGFMATLANPYNCVYSAQRLAQDQNYPGTNTIGAGPFQFAEYVRGSHWAAKRFDGYYKPSLPYLDGYKVVLMSAGAPINALASGQIDAVMRSMTPQEVERITSQRGDKVKGKTVLINTPVLLTFNLKHKPFDDARVRKALTLAIDRRGGMGPISKITNMAAYGGIIKPDYEMALPAAELAKLPGFGPDINASRAEAKRLLAEAGQSNLKFQLTGRNQSGHWQSIPIFVVDQWRQIGLNVEINSLEPAAYLRSGISGDFDVIYDASPTAADDPSLVIIKYLPGSNLNFGGIADPMLTDLFAQQRQALDTAARKKLVNAFEERTLAEAYTVPLFWASLTVLMSSDIQGFYAVPSTQLGYDFREVWRE